MPPQGSELLHGTLELLVLRLLEGEPLNGYAIGRRIEELTDDALKVDEGSLYPALYRMERRGWLQSSWGTTENNRRAKFYRLTSAGRKQLAQEAGYWVRVTAGIARIMETA